MFTSFSEEDELPPPIPTSPLPDEAESQEREQQELMVMGEEPQQEENDEFIDDTVVSGYTRQLPGNSITNHSNDNYEEQEEDRDQAIDSQDTEAMPEKPVEKRLPVGFMVELQQRQQVKKENL